MLFSPAAIGSYVTAVGLVGLAVYHLSIGDVPGAVTAATAALGIHLAANSGPAAPTK